MFLGLSSVGLVSALSVGPVIPGARLGSPPWSWGATAEPHGSRLEPGGRMLSLESLAGGEAKGGEDLRASIPPVARWGCDL